MEFVGKGIIILTSEMSRQLEKLPHGEVSVLRFLKVHVMKGENVCQGRSNVQSIMEMADLPVAFGPKMADQLSASLSHQKKRVFESTPGILSKFVDVIHTPCDRKSFL